MSEREFDIVVFGAGGVTGRRVAAYLAERSAETELRWAAAGRDRERLRAMLARVGAGAPDIVMSGAGGVTGRRVAADLGEPELIVADVADAGSLAQMASRARVVLDLVGPYTRYGRPVIEACVQQGAHYADLTGEIPFVRATINEFDRAAAAAGVKVVQVCGFEALPGDLLALLASERARERYGEGLEQADLEVTVSPPPGLPRPSDTISGGTYQSLAAVVGAPDARLATDPAALIDDPALAERVRRVSPITLAPRRARGGGVLAPMAPAAFINPAVIQRTEALTAAATGRTAEPFRFHEGVVLSGAPVTLPARWAFAEAMSATQAGVRALARVPPGLRRGVGAALARIGPSSGFGPADDRLEGWRWSMSLRARTPAGRELETRVEAEGHPGYLATARLLGEAGMLLSEDGAIGPGGCLTPAAALGTARLERFERAGLRFSEAD